MRGFLSRAANPTSLLIAAAVLLLVLIFLLHRLDWDIKNNAVMISAFVAIVGFLFNSSVKLHSELRDRTFDFLKMNRESGEYLDACRFLGQYFNEHASITPEEAKLLISKETEDQETEDKGQSAKGPDYAELRKHLYIIGNLFEEMALAIKYKEVTESILADFFMGIFIRFYENAGPYIVVLRNPKTLPDSIYGERERPEVFCTLDDLYKRWKPRYEKHILKLKHGAGAFGGL